MSEPADLLLEPVSEDVITSLFAEADARVNSGGGTVAVDALLMVRLIAQVVRAEDLISYLRCVPCPPFCGQNGVLHVDYCCTRVADEPGFRVLLLKHRDGK